MALLPSRPVSVRLLLSISAGNLLIGVAAAALWRLSGDDRWIQLYFRGLGAAFLVGFSLVEFRLCVAALRGFSPGDYLRPAWILITIAAACRLIGFVLSELLGSPTAPSGPAAAYRQAGLALGSFGALPMLLLGLLIVRRAYRRHGLLARLRWIDMAAVVAMAVFSIREMYDGLRLSTAFGVLRVLSFTTEPVLTALLYVALVIRRSTLPLAGGLVSRCWTSYCTAVFLTLLADLGMWAVTYSVLPQQASVAVWYVWLLAATAFALGPAYQVEAMRQVSAPTLQR